MCKQGELKVISLIFPLSDKCYKKLILFLKRILKDQQSCQKQTCHSKVPWIRVMQIVFWKKASYPFRRGLHMNPCAAQSKGTFAHSFFPGHSQMPLWCCGSTQREGDVLKHGICRKFKAEKCPGCWGEVRNPHQTLLGYGNTPCAFWDAECQTSSALGT